MADDDRMKRSPDACPKAYEAEVNLLDRTVINLFNSKKLPYYIQASIAAKGYVSMEDVGDLYDSADKARELGPKEWGFDPTLEPGKTKGWTADEAHAFDRWLSQVVVEKVPH